jgi:hypothetical protein
MEDGRIIRYNRDMPFGISMIAIGGAGGIALTKGGAERRRAHTHGAKRRIRRV